MRRVSGQFDNSRIFRNAGIFFSFIIPACVLMISFWAVGIYPGGESTPFLLDLRMEHLPFFAYSGHSTDLLNTYQYQAMGGMGNSLIGSYEMYCSPLGYLFSFLDISAMADAIWFMNILLIGFSGVSCFYYLKNGFLKMSDTGISVILSVCYALMSCTVIYTIVPVWIWGVIFLPFVAAGVDRVVDRRKWYFLAVSLFLSIVFNYYTSYIIIVFSLIYLLYRLFMKVYDKQTIISSVLKFFTGLIAAVLLSAFSWLPAFLDLFNGKTHESRSIHLGLIRNPIKVLLSLLPMSYSGLQMHDMPYIYCGVFVLASVVLFFISKKVVKREKIVSLIFALFFILSFCVGIFDDSWMFFSEPNGYPSRYSFTFSFVLIIFAARFLRDSKLSEIAGSKGAAIKMALLAYVILEAGLNSIYLVREMDSEYGPYAPREEYVRVCHTMTKLVDEYSLDDPFGRTVKNWRYSNLDGLLYGYNDIEYFSSSYNYDLHAFMESLGLSGQKHLLRSTGLTPIVSSIMGVEHYVWVGNPGDYEYEGTLDGLNIYSDHTALPMAFCVNGDLDSESSFSDNPFENINSFVNDLSGISDIFLIEDPVSDVAAYTVQTRQGMALWMYAIPSSNEGGDIHFGDKHYVYYDGQPVAAYADEVSPYCVMLGMGTGEEVTFTFSDSDLPASVYFASYDSEKAGEVLAMLAENAGHDFKEIRNGFEFSLDPGSAGSVFTSVPYLKDFKIYVDGKQLDYRPYRNAFISFDVTEGNHDIKIVYRDRGLLFGSIASGTSAITLTAIYLLQKKSKRELEHNE